jgi:hypothetical protein
MADDFARPIEAFELLHGQEVIGEARRLQLDGKRHPAISLRFKKHSTKGDLLVVAGGGGDALYPLQFPRPGVGDGGSKQADKHERTQPGEWASPWHEDSSICLSAAIGWLPSAGECSSVAPLMEHSAGVVGCNCGSAGDTRQ